MEGITERLQATAYTQAQAARALKVGRTRVQQLITQGHLKTIIVEGRRMIDARSLKNLIEWRKTQSEWVNNTRIQGAATR